MKKLFLLIAFISINLTIVKGQDKTVTLIVTGQGKTQDEAKQNAFRSAIEQAFGTFISSKTEILNDNLIKDEIVSVANGNIQQFEVISEVQIPDGGFATTLKTTVSVTKLSSFVESKGVTVEFKGDLLAANIKQQMLNEQNETKSIQNISNTCKEILDRSCNFEIVRGQPVQKNNDNNQWAIPININVKFNKNIELFNQYLINSIKGLSMSSDEVNQYKQLSKKTYKIVIGGGSVGGTTDNIEHVKTLANSNSNLKYKIIFDEQILFESNDSKSIVKEYNKLIKKENAGRGGSLSDYQKNLQISERIKRYKIQYFDPSINPIYYFRSFSTVVSIIDLIYYTKHAVLNFEISNGINKITSEKLFADLKEHEIVNGNGNVFRYSAGCAGFKIIKDNLDPIFNYNSSANGPTGIFNRSISEYGKGESKVSPYEKIGEDRHFLNSFRYNGNREFLLKDAINEKYGFLIQADNILLTEQINIQNRYDRADNEYKAVISLFDYKYSDKIIENLYFEDFHTLSELEKIQEYKINPIKDL